MLPPELSAQALALLEAQPWRGNIRELRNVLEQAAMRGDSQRIEVEQLEAVLRESGVQHVAVATATATALAQAGQIADQESRETVTPPKDNTALLRPLSEQVAELEQRAIAAALEAHRGDKAAAAKMLGMARATLYARLESD
jgi:DNA-binding NtrC family response regulator